MAKVGDGVYLKNSLEERVSGGRAWEWGNVQNWKKYLFEFGKMGKRFLVCFEKNEVVQGLEPMANNISRHISHEF